MKGSCMFAAIAAAVLLASGPVARDAHAQAPRAAPQADSVGRYRFDLARYYFATPEAELEARAHLRARLDELRRAGGRIATSAAALHHALRLADSVQAEAKRHTAYLYLRTQLNTLDEASAASESALEAELAAATSVVNGGLLRLDDRTVARYLAALPALEPYRFAIASVRRLRTHTLPAEQEAVVSRIGPVAADWPAALYHRLIARTDFGTLSTPAGELRVLRDRGAIAALPDTALRAEGIRRLWAGYAQQRDLYAMALAGTVRARNAIAQSRGYQDAPEETYTRAYLSPREVHALLAQVRPRAELYKSYQRTRVRLGRAPPSFTIGEASEAIRTALAPLGEDYARELAALLDPASGRVDLGGGPNRAGGGSSTGYSATPSGVYMETFAGSYPDLSRLAHESSHAVEDQLIYVHGVPAVYATGAEYLTEAYALFTELVVADAPYARSDDAGLKRFYLAQFLGKAMELFHGAQDADLEQSIYDSVAERGGVVTADDLDSLTSRVDTAYSIAGETHPEVRARWITARLLYEDPLYLYNYMYSGLLALKMFEGYQHDPAAFAPRYVALLCSGYRAPPSAAVRQALGIDLEDPHLLDDATAFLESRLRALKAE